MDHFASLSNFEPAPSEQQVGDALAFFESELRQHQRLGTFPVDDLEMYCRVTNLKGLDWLMILRLEVTLTGGDLVRKTGETPREFEPSTYGEAVVRILTELIKVFNEKFPSHYSVFPFLYVLEDGRRHRFYSGATFD